MDKSRIRLRMGSCVVEGRGMFPKAGYFGKDFGGILLNVRRPETDKYLCMKLTSLFSACSILVSRRKIFTHRRFGRDGTKACLWRLAQSYTTFFAFLMTSDQHPPPDQHHSGSEDSEDEEDEEDEWDKIPKIDIDLTKLTPLSPEVISKQVHTSRSVLEFIMLTLSIGHNQPRFDA